MISVRLDNSLENELNYISQEQQISKSKIIKDSLIYYFDMLKEKSKEKSAYELGASLFGKYSSDNSLNNQVSKSISNILDNLNPFELNNLIGDNNYSKELNNLRKQLDNWMEEINDLVKKSEMGYYAKFLNDQIPFNVNVLDKLYSLIKSLKEFEDSVVKSFKGKNEKSN
jgi:hypothetical protein